MAADDGTSFQVNGPNSAKKVSTKLTTLTENSLIQISTPESDTAYRVLKVKPSANSAIVIDTNLNNKAAGPFRITIDEFLMGGDGREVTILDKEIFLNLYTYEPGDKDKVKRDNRWKYFEAYIDDSRLLDARKWSTIVSELSKELGLCDKQTRNLLRRWIQTGFAKNALSDLKGRMGGQGKQRNQATRTERLGPYTKADKVNYKATGVQRKSGIPITAEVAAHFKAAEVRYRKGLRNVEGARRPTFEQAYQWLLETYYRDKCEEGNKGK